MDDVCQLLRTFRKYKEQSSETDTEWKEDSEDVMERSEVNFVISLIDILESEFSKLGWSFKTAILTPAANTFGIASFSSTHHFVYGILDLIQQHVRTTNCGKVINEVMKSALQIVQKLPSRSFVRTKAFEVLASLKDKNVANDKTIEAIKTWSDGGAQKVAKDEWRIIKVRFEDMELDCKDAMKGIDRHFPAKPARREVTTF
jgi:hypothetical protein